MQIKSTQCVIKSRRAQNLQASDWLIKASYPYVDYLTYCPVFSFFVWCNLHLREGNAKVPDAKSGRTWEEENWGISVWNINFHFNPDRTLQFDTRGILRLNFTCFTLKFSGFQTLFCQYRWIRQFVTLLTSSWRLTNQIWRICGRYICQKIMPLNFAWRDSTAF